MWMQRIQATLYHQGVSGTANGATRNAQARALADWFETTVERSDPTQATIKAASGGSEVPRSSVPTAAGWRRLLADPGKRWEAA